MRRGAVRGAVICACVTSRNRVAHQLLILFLSLSCARTGHCKALEPKWDELARDLSLQNSFRFIFLFHLLTSHHTGHCKALEPKWDELARDLKNVDNLTIAKIDSTANDYDRQRWAVSGFPTSRYCDCFVFLSVFFVVCNVAP
jgi:hypothetical protein